MVFDISVISIYLSLTFLTFFLLNIVLRFVPTPACTSNLLFLIAA